MDLIPIISQLEKEADKADDKIMESDSPQYYDGYGDGVQYAIDLLRKAAIAECERRIAEAELAKAQNFQSSLINSRLNIPLVENPLGGCNAITRLFHKQRG